MTVDLAVRLTCDPCRTNADLSPIYQISMSSRLLVRSDTSEIIRPLLCSPRQMDTKSGKACHFILVMNLSNSCNANIWSEQTAEYFHQNLTLILASAKLYWLIGLMLIALKVPAWSSEKPADGAPVLPSSEQRGTMWWHWELQTGQWGRKYNPANHNCRILTINTEIIQGIIEFIRTQTFRIFISL